MLHQPVVRLSAAILVSTLALAQPRTQDVVRTFAVRIDGRVVGSLTETEARVNEEGREVLRFTSSSVVKIELLGAQMDQRIEQTWLLDPDDRRVLRFSSTMTVGQQKTALGGKLVDGAMQLDNGRAPVDPQRVVVAPDYRWLLARGPQQVGDKLILDWLVPELGGVQQAAIARAADREVDVLGTRTPVRAYVVDLVALHLEATVLVTRDGGELVHYAAPATKLVMDRAPAGDIARIGRVDLTDRILVGTNLDLDDASTLTFVRLRAKLDTGKDVTVASLNVPGQTFTGTAVDGHVDGVFEIRAQRHDGAGSPPFPVPAGTFAAAALQPYLAPESDVIQSDDAAIVEQARELARGATTCFQVVERLARWTHEEIAYVIPGGGSAKGTFESRQGECGGHSRLLAAMLRSLGIPARTPMGAMYVPLHGGSFGQHMWTEVWLGDAIGWLPVDCTAGQPTWIDATHIRLASGVTMFRPQSIEVLDHEPKASVVDASASVVRRTDAYPFLSGAPLVYTWWQNGQQLGDERVVYTSDGAGLHAFDGSLRLADGQFTETTRTEVGADGRLLSFHADRTAGPQQSTFDVAIADGKAVCARKSMDGDRSDTVTVDAAVFALHNNCTSHFLLALSRYWPLAEGAEVKARMFHTEQRSTLPLTLRGGGSEAITIGGTEVQARIVQVELAGLAITLHVDAQGRLLRYSQKQGGIRIELQQL
ncbi:MAG: transglutaminase domain-containing protein [Planctomycetes bacterium]|nr:transglutaminase domain-containing protein [Planctomycetota bacterium]